MDRDEKKVGPLKKVVVRIEAGISEDPTRADPLEFVFIYGIGAGGLCPLEIAVAEKREGEVSLVPVKKGDLRLFFGHISPPNIPICDIAGDVIVKMTVISASEADPREVIKAMAEAAECGSNCCGH
jgi:hypothetical protein